MKKLLIANRGEIALRIIRACRDYGLASVAVYADADVDGLWLGHADEAFPLPGATPAATYLNGPALIAIARRAGADAIHPGYGFLSESADFARAVADAGLIWVGPDADTIARLGDKIAAREIARKVGAPLVPGSDGPVSGADDIRDFVRRHGLPVVVKAAGGGGGRGMRVIRETEDIEPLLNEARSEATTAFGNPACYVERFLDRPRHIEAQILADHHGNIAVAGLRDCSLQRRHQKLVEEAPAPFLPDDLARRITDAARAICAEAGYTSAGTVEFLLGADGMLSFLEVNTRLQVEHPVTEEVAGIDIVTQQLRIAEGLALDCPADLPARAHAIEFRINAEDPGRGFLPMPGRITRFVPPSGPGVRVDCGVDAGSTVPAAFDSLLAKLIVTGPTRAAALARARRALAEFRIEGIPSTLPFARAVTEAADFNGDGPFAVHTGWIEEDFADDLAAALNRPAPDETLLRLPAEVGGQRADLALSAAALARLARALGTAPAAAPVPASTPGPAPAPGGLRAPGASVLLRWLADEGAVIETGQPLAVIEAMKSEMTLHAPSAGVLRRRIAEGTELAADDLLADLA
ncbi:MAG: biotin carboxylase N-terminal domain-containing protein [Paracoccus sp. (in: a-proteobacteria)]|nr:biotin carboxylase N-terminal domain-containing protein [Paracoccus sp. (in: a-proteobacteria)]